MIRIGEREAKLLKVRAVVTCMDDRTTILWDDGLVQTNYRVGDMGCPAPIPDEVVADAYLRSLPDTCFFTVLL